MHGLLKSKPMQKIGRLFEIILKLYKADNFTKIKNQLFFLVKKGWGVDLMKLEFASMTLKQLKAVSCL